MAVQVLPLKGYKSLKALNGFHALLLGLKMLPAYIGEDYKTFYSNFEHKTEEEKEFLLKEAVLFVELSEAEVMALVCFAKDSNGVPYKSVNIGNLQIDQLHEIIVAVCMEIGRIKIDLLSESEKKNCLSSQ